MIHLDCSLSYRVVSRIDPSITLDDYTARFIAPPKCRDLTDFLARAPSSFPLMQTEEHLRLVTFDLFEQLAKDNMLYAEIRFAPLLHTEGGLSAHEVVASVERAAADFGPQSGHGVEGSRRVAEWRPRQVGQAAEPGVGGRRLLRHRGSHPERR